MLLGSVLIVMAITVVQERRTERALEALRDLSSPRALVVRGGRRHALPVAMLCEATFYCLRKAIASPRMPFSEARQT